MQEAPEIKIRCIRSYDGLTFSFDSKDCYDLYRLYEKRGDSYEEVISSKDLLVHHPSLQENKLYLVVGYKIEGDNYVLRAKSKDTTCKVLEKKTLKGKPVISVVCPVYNAETCISNCIDSLLLSTQNNMEFIFVDDGSTDRSKDIIAWYQENYPGIIRYVYQENKGVSFARNTGIQLARGEFIGLIDDDDYVHPRMYEELLNAAIVSNCPIAIGKTIIKDPKGGSKIVLNVPNEDNEKGFSIPYDEMMRLKTKCDVHNIFFVAVWHKIIRADIVKSHLFPTSNHYEDTAYTRMIYSYIDRFAFAYDAYYIWDQRRRNTFGTASTNIYKRKSDDIYEIHRKFFDANFFGFEKGNKYRIDWLSYDLIREIYNYLKKTNSIKKDNDLYKIVVDDIKNHFLLVYLKNNIHFKEDPELLEFINNIEE